MIRLLTFGAVISVHSLAFTEQPDNRAAAAAMMLLQFGREVFFSLTGFVLVYSTLNRPGRTTQVWRKRMVLVGVPYITWSAIYYSYSIWGPQHLRPSVSGFATDLLYGGAMYHLYFLLVTMQLYLVFPLLMRFVRATSAKAGPILIAVSVANLAWLGVVQWVRAPIGAPGWFWVHAYELLPTYSMYVLAGCYAAVHLARLQAFADRHPRRLRAAAAVCAAGALIAYSAQLSHMPPRIAASVLQPATALSCMAALICVYQIGSKWARGSRRHEAAISRLSDLSFGVYLSHPLVLQILLDHGLANHDQRLTPILATAVGFGAAVAGGIAISMVARETPLSLALTGRPWDRRRAAKTVIYKPTPTPVFDRLQLKKEGQYT